MTRSEESGGVPLEQVLLDPGSFFETPEDVLARENLADREKIEILRRWEYDASEACVALEEGMPGPETDLLRRILLALASLGCSVDLDRVGPTKQHGIPRSAVRCGPSRG